MASTLSEAPATTPGPQSRWTGGRIASVVIGAVLALLSVGVLAGGGAALWADQTQRQGGYLTTGTAWAGSTGYAVTSDAVTLNPAGAPGWFNSVVGKVRIRVTPASQARPIFVGVAPASAVRAYLAGARYDTLTGFDRGHGTYVWHPGTAKPGSPLAADIWTGKASGTGTQTVTWTARQGSWMFVVMNANGTPGVAVNVDAGATVPGLTGLAIGLLAGGAVLLVIAVVLIAVPVRNVGRAA